MNLYASQTAHRINSCRDDAFPLLGLAEGTPDKPPSPLIILLTPKEWNGLRVFCRHYRPRNALDAAVTIRTGKPSQQQWAPLG